MSQHQKPKHNAKPDQKRMIIILIIAAVTILLIIGATVFALIKISKDAQQTQPTSPLETAVAPTTAQPTAASSITEPITEAKTTDSAPTEETPAQTQMDEELEGMLSSRGISADTLSEQETSQIITVSSFGNSATIEFWEISDHKWTKDDALTVSGYVGEMGVTENMSEYIKATPAGFYPVMDAFYIYNKPDTGLDSFQITEDTYWVDDPSSDFYNQHVEGTRYQDWNSAEHMIDYSSYAYGFVIGYNLSCVKGAGSAIFFHLGSGPTAGCVATSESYVLSYLSKLSASANPFILIN